jgi:hypothetical protein
LAAFQRATASHGSLAERVAHSDGHVRTNLVAPGLPMDLVQEGAMEAAEKATCIVSQDILALVREACTNAAEPKIDETVSVLAERCANARPLVESYLKRIRGGRP